MLSVQTYLGTSSKLNLLMKLFPLSDLQIKITKEHWLTQDGWACPFNNSAKIGRGTAKQHVTKNQKEVIQMYTIHNIP